MPKKIVLTIDGNDNLCHFPNAFHLKVLKQTDNGPWQTDQLIPLNLNVKNTEELRVNIRDAIDAIDDGTDNILISQGITGIPYYVFDKMGFAIFVVDQIDDSLLNEIFAETEKNKEELAEDALLPRKPIEVATGIYYLDFLLLESKHSELTTKQILMPFFDTTPFLSLSIRISHIPPWLEFGEYAEKFDLVAKNLEDAVLVTLTPKTCGS